MIKPVRGDIPSAGRRCRPSRGLSVFITCQSQGLAWTTTRPHRGKSFGRHFVTIVLIGCIFNSAM